MSQNPIPQVIKEWQQLTSNPPKVCYSCEWYRVNTCDKFQATPPEEFANTPDSCPEWVESIPF
jgi:hypothetical protein